MGPSDRYLRLTRLAQNAFGRGRLERALRLFQAAEAEAGRLGDRELCDRAFCNRCVVLAELDRLHLVAGELKHVLMRSRDPFTSWMAAYYTSQSFEAEGNMNRALAYARRASELAALCGELRARHASANQHGVLALKTSAFAEAAERFAEALELATDDRIDEIFRAVVRDNLGYCWMCTGKVPDGYALCGDAATTLEALGARQYLPEVYQDLCYGALELGRSPEGFAWGERAIALAREYQHPSVERNTLMLLADAAIDAGDDEDASGFLDRLAAHYPDARGMKTFLQAFDVRRVINLKA